MKISLTPKEAEQLKEIVSSVDEDILEDIVDSLNSKLVKTKLSPTGVVIKINPNYTEDFLAMYGKFMKLIVPQIKAVYETVIVFQQEAEKIFEKHTEEETKEEVEENA